MLAAKRVLFRRKLVWNCSLREIALRLRAALNARVPLVELDGRRGLPVHPVDRRVYLVGPDHVVAPQVSLRHWATLDQIALQVSDPVPLVEILAWKLVQFLERFPGLGPDRLRTLRTTESMH
jgi:hypothetical protein